MGLARSNRLCREDPPPWKKPRIPTDSCAVRKRFTLMKRKIFRMCVFALMYFSIEFSEPCFLHWMLSLNLSFDLLRMLCFHVPFVLCLHTYISDPGDVYIFPISVL